MKASEIPGLKAKAVRAFDLSPDGHTGFELAQATRAKLSTPAGKATYGKRFQVSEGVFAVTAKMAGFTLCSLMEWWQGKVTCTQKTASEPTSWAARAASTG